MMSWIYRLPLLLLPHVVETSPPPPIHPPLSSLARKALLGQDYPSQLHIQLKHTCQVMSRSSLVWEEEERGSVSVVLSRFKLKKVFSEELFLSFRSTSSPTTSPTAVRGILYVNSPSPSSIRPYLINPTSIEYRGPP